MKTCQNCNRSEKEIPLVTLQYHGNQVYLCTGCFPTLLHSPEKLSQLWKDFEMKHSTDRDNK